MATSPPQYKYNIDYKYKYKETTFDCTVSQDGHHGINLNEMKHLSNAFAMTHSPRIFELAMMGKIFEVDFCNQLQLSKYYPANPQNSKSFLSPDKVLKASLPPFLHSGASLPSHGTPPGTLDRLRPEKS